MLTQIRAVAILGVSAMSDLILSLCIMGGLTLISTGFGIWLQRRCSPPQVAMTVGAALAGMFVYLVWVWDSPLLVALLPFSSVVILGNWLAPVGGLLAGVCACSVRVHVLRRVCLSTVLLGLCCYSLARPLLGTVPRCPSVEFERVLEFQTTEQTCSAACAAGLLRLHGIDASEREMAELCLTRRGTHWLGVYRGLKLKTEGTEWDVVAERLSGGEILQAAATPGILSLSCHGWASARSQDSELPGLTGHSVVRLGSNRPGEVTVFDPSPDYGFGVWDESSLSGIQDAILLRLVSRRGTTVRTPASDSPDDLYQWNQVYWKRR
ncbi:MAG: hypothetical protein RL215_2717 [Planctomycetota bacterium]